MQVEVKSLPELHLAYVRNQVNLKKGEYNPEVSAAFDQVANWVGANHFFSQDTLCVGVYYDHIDTTSSERFTYDSGFTIPLSVTEAGGMIGIQDIAAGKYAVYHVEMVNEGEGSFQKAITELGKGYDVLYGIWLNESGQELDQDRPTLELYLTGKEADIIKIDCCIPIK